MTDLVAAECGIRQLHARYVDAVWRQDDRDFADCFAADGVWKIAGMTMRGREAIAEGCRTLVGRCAHVQLIVQTPILDVSGPTAIGRLPMIELVRMPDGTGSMNIGYYHDHYVEAAGRWRFARRFWSMKYRGPPDLSAAFLGTPDYGSFPAGPAEDEETLGRSF